MNKKDCEAIWNKRHEDRAHVFLKELKELCSKHKAILWTEPNNYPIFALIYDTTCPDIYFEICPEIVRKYF